MINKNYEYRMQCQRQKEAKRADLVRSINEDVRLSQVNVWQDKADEARLDKMRRLGRYREIEKEMAQKRKEEMEKRKDDLCHQKLKQEMEKLEAEKLLVEKSRERLIVENHPELRALKSKLNLIYVRKERALQLEAKTLQEISRKQEDSELEEFLLTSKPFFREDDSKEENEKKNSLKKELRKTLREQIKEQESNLKREKELENIKDLKLLSNVIAEIEAEEDARMLQRRKQQEKTRKEIKDSENLWRKAKEENEKLMQEELEKIEAYQKELESRENTKKESRTQKLAQEERLYKLLEEQHEERMRQEEELVHAREVLSTYQKEQEAESKEKRRVEMLTRQREELKQAFEQTKLARAKREEQLLREKEKFRLEIHKKLKQDEALELELMRKEFMKKKTLRDGLDEQIKERLRKEENLREQAEQETRQQVEKENFERNLVLKAKQALLDQHQEVIKIYGNDLGLRRSSN
eukprot:augustus_masked-scaffold_12-processed-gene-3.3-mRNA-1 protein AED:1.00 eAED:1.00 QI:0/-1/0/0/-1/1/1/0/467